MVQSRIEQEMVQIRLEPKSRTFGQRHFIDALLPWDKERGRFVCIAPAIVTTRLTTDAC